MLLYHYCTICIYYMTLRGVDEPATMTFLLGNMTISLMMITCTSVYVRLTNMTYLIGCGSMEGRGWGVLDILAILPNIVFPGRYLA
jgi:hypothetical protein